MQWPVMNVKCLVFSGGLIAAYWTLPCRYDEQKWLATAAIGTAGYVGMAWYDHIYGCDRMRAGALSGLYAPVKPPIRDGHYS